MAERKSREKALEEELELYRSRSMIRKRWEMLGKEAQRAIALIAIGLLIAAALSFYFSFRSLSEPETLSYDSYRRLIDTKSGSQWMLSNKDRKTFEEIIQLPDLKKKVAVSSSDDVLYLVFTDGSISPEYPFSLSDGAVRGSVEGMDAVLYFTESASGSGETLSVYMEGLEAELRPYSASEQL